MRRKHIWLIILCVTAVAVSALFQPLVGVCGTAPWFMARMAALTVTDVLTLGRSIENDGVLQAVVGGVFYVGFFVGMIAIWVWWVKASLRWFSQGLVVWTVFY